MLQPHFCLLCDPPLAPCSPSWATRMQEQAPEKPMRTEPRGHIRTEPRGALLEPKSTALHSYPPPFAPCSSPYPSADAQHQRSAHPCMSGCPNNSLMVERVGGVTAGHWWSLQLLTQNTNFICRRHFLITQEDFFHSQNPFCTCPFLGSRPRCSRLIGPIALRKHEWQHSSSSICQATDLSPLARACLSWACESQSREEKEKGALDREAITKNKRVS